MNSIDRLTELFMRFPGIGPKQAKRFVYFLLREHESYKRNIIDAIEELKFTGKQCTECFRYFSDREKGADILCSICRDESRDKAKLLLVEKELDCDAIEKTGAYDGVYFITGGLVPILADKPSEYIRVRELVALVHQKISNANLREVVFAFPVTDDGDSTKEYLSKTLSQIVGIKEVTFTTLARGLSSGLELEYVDRDTFKSAFERRS